LEGEQKRGRETKRKEEEQWGTSFQAKQLGGIETNIAITTSIAKEVGNASTASDNRAYFNERSGENRGSNGMSLIEDRRDSMKPICYGCRQKGE